MSRLAVMKDDDAWPDPTIVGYISFWLSSPAIDLELFLRIADEQNEIVMEGGDE